MLKRLTEQNICSGKRVSKDVKILYWYLKPPIFSCGKDKMIIAVLDNTNNHYINNTVHAVLCHYMK